MIRGADVTARQAEFAEREREREAGREAEADAPPARVPSRRRLLQVGPAIAVGLLFAAGCLTAAFRVPSDSDGAVFALAGWDMLHGNVLLHHWAMADAAFTTFEVPLYAVVEALFGLGPGTARIVAVLTYMVVAAFTIALATEGTRGGRAWSRSTLTLAALAAPICFGGIAFLLLEMPNHIGTAAYLMLAFLLYARWPERRLTPWVLCVVLTAGQLGDATIRYIAVTTIVVVAAARMLAERKLRGPDLKLALAAVVSVPVAVVLRHLLVHLGAYSETSVNVRLAPLHAWPGNAKGTLTSLLFLYNIEQVHLRGPHSTGAYIAAAVGVVALLAGIYGFVRTLVRWNRAGVIDRLAVVAIVLYIVPYTVSAMGNATYTFGYEFFGVVPLFAVLAARNLFARPSAESVPVKGRRDAAWIAAFGTAAAAILATAAFQPTVISSQQQLADWLSAHGLTHGVSGYWDAASVTVDSGNKVQVLAVTKRGSGYGMYAWHTKKTWYNPSVTDANFFIAELLDSGTAESDVQKAYGAPSATYLVGGQLVMVYPFNLLDHSAAEPGSR